MCVIIVINIRDGLKAFFKHWTCFNIPSNQNDNISCSKKPFFGTFPVITIAGLFCEGWERTTYGVSLESIWSNLKEIILLFPAAEVFSVLNLFDISSYQDFMADGVLHAVSTKLSSLKQFLI